MEGGGMTSEQRAEIERTWISYASERPQVAGVYEWKVPSKAFTGNVLFLAHFRERHAGFEKVLSPSFDRWDGWRAVVPDGTEWRHAPDATQIKEYAYTNLRIEGLENLPCPFCKAVPEWHATESWDRCVMVNSAPHKLNSWWLKCCKWATTEHGDPKRIAQERNAALGIESLESQ